MSVDRTDALDIMHEMVWVPFQSDAVGRIKECLEDDGDLTDLLVTLFLEWEGDQELSYSQINGLVIDAVKEMEK